MEGHWWSCVLGLLCMLAEVVLSSLTVSQSPSSTSQIKVNSSAEITCSVSSTNVLGFYLRGTFHDKRSIVFLSLRNGKVGKHTTAAEFDGRIQVIPNKNVKDGVELTLQLDLLGPDDTDLYYCEWLYLSSQTKRESQSSNGTILIIRENDPHEECNHQILDHILISVTVAAFTVILFLFIGIMTLRCRRVKKRFRPAKCVMPPRPNRPQHVCPQRSNEHYPYLITSENYMGRSVTITQ